eukprot:1481103-Ditylum_brightwellii.AAC.2
MGNAVSNVPPGAVGPDNVKEASWKLSEVVANLACWFANTRPAWATYRAIISGYLTPLGKCPDIYPVRVGKILLQMLGKCIK